MSLLNCAAVSHNFCRSSAHLNTTSSAHYAISSSMRQEHGPILWNPHTAHVHAKEAHDDPLICAVSAKCLQKVKLEGLSCLLNRECLENSLGCATTVTGPSRASAKRAMWPENRSVLALVRPGPSWGEWVFSIFRRSKIRP